MRRLSRYVLPATFVSWVLLAPTEASACGGRFSPPGHQPLDRDGPSDGLRDVAMSGAVENRSSDPACSAARGAAGATLPARFGRRCAFDEIGRGNAAEIERLGDDHEDTARSVLAAAALKGVR